jgi:hypothetical protein
LTLFNEQVVGPLAAGDFITSLDVADPNRNQGDTFTFALVAGDGATLTKNRFTLLGVL